MLLMSPSDAAAAIGANCGGHRPTPDDAGLMNILRLITPRVESALNVNTLTRGSYLDHFILGSMPRGDRVEQQLLLSNAFLVKGSVSLVTPSGELIDLSVPEDPTMINEEMGTVTLRSWSRGAYRVEYISGFEVPAAPDPLPPGFDRENSVLLGVPDWIKSIVVALLVSWYRTRMTATRAGKDFSFGQMEQSLRREIYTSIYQRYQRPRVAVTFSEKMEYGN